MWIWEKGKLVANTKCSNNIGSEIHQISCNPFDLLNIHICVVGQSLFRIFRFVEGQFKIMSQVKPDYVRWTTELITDNYN